MKKLLLTITSCFLAQASATTLSLLDAYNLAEHHDLTYQNARETYSAARQLRYITRAPLLPQIVASANIGYADTIRPRDGVNSFSYGYQITLQQVVFDYVKYSTYRQSRYLVKAAHATYQAAQQDLILNLTTAYFDVLQNYDELRFQQKSADSFLAFKKQTTARFKVGQDTISDVYIAKANYDNAKAVVITAKNAVFTSKESLFNIINTNFDDLYRLKDNIPLNPLEPDNAEYWARQAKINNSEVKASYYQMLAAKENININCAEHLPVVNFIASYGATSIDSRPINLSYGWSVGLTGSVNIYAGGGIRAATQQAQFNYIIARENYKLVKRGAGQNVIAAHRTVTADLSQAKALKTAVEAAKKATESARESYNAGTQTAVDVTTKIAQELDAQSEYSQARHTYLLDRMRLKRLVGNLHRSDVIYINNLLEKK